MYDRLECITHTYCDIILAYSGSTIYVIDGASGHVMFSLTQQGELRVNSYTPFVTRTVVLALVQRGLVQVHAAADRLMTWDGIQVSEQLTPKERPDTIVEGNTTWH